MAVVVVAAAELGGGELVVIPLLHHAPQLQLHPWLLLTRCFLLAASTLVTALTTPLSASCLPRFLRTLPAIDAMVVVQ